MVFVAAIFCLSDPVGLRRLHGRVRQEHVGDLDANTDADSNNIDPDPDADPHANDQFGRLLCGGLAYVSGDVVSYGGNKWTANPVEL